MSFNVVNTYQTFRDSTGAVRANGTVTFFVNTTTTKTSIFSDEALTIAQNNPYTLDAFGRIAGDVKFSGKVTILEANSDGSNPLTTDNVTTIGTADTLKNDLADTATVTKGDALVGVKKTATGAVATDQHEVNERTLSVFDFMTEAQIADVVARTELLDMTTPIQAALDGGRSLYFPPGTYKITATVVQHDRGKQVRGAGAETTIISVIGAIVGWRMGNNLTTGSVNELIHLSDMTFVGTGTGGGSITVGSTGLELGAVAASAGAKAMTGTVSRVRIRGLDEGLNPRNNQGVSVEDCDFVGNNYGIRNLFVSTEFSTATTFRRCRINSNVINGMWLESAWQYIFLSCSIELNGKEGVVLNKIDGAILASIIYQGCFVEANCTDGTTGIANMSVLSPETTRASELTLINTEFNSATSVLNYHLILECGGVIMMSNRFVGTAHATPINTIHANANGVATLQSTSQFTNPEKFAHISSTRFEVSSSGSVDFSQIAGAGAGSTSQELDFYDEGNWTPVLTFATPGDLSVAYSIQTGTYERFGRTVIAQFDITTSTFTHTTASGLLNITGVDFTAGSAAGQTGPIVFSGITKATYTNFVAEMAVSSKIITLKASGSGVGLASVAAADMPTAGSVILRGTVTYYV